MPAPVVAEIVPVLYRRRLVPGAGLPAPALIGGAVIAVLVVIAIFAPFIAPHDPNAIKLTESLGPVRAGHLLGQDSSGRDTLSRLVFGTRVSLLGPLLVVLIATVVGVPLGLLAGYVGGLVDGILARSWDVMFAFPSLLLAIVIVASFGAGFWTATIAIAITYVPLMARCVRGFVLVEREKAYVDACKVQGLSGVRVAGAHVLPNVSALIIAQATLFFGYALLDLAGLAFLGLGVQPPTADWGAMLTDGRKFILLSYTEVVAASVVIAVAVVAFNMLGDALTHRLGRSR